MKISIKFAIAAGVVGVWSLCSVAMAENRLALVVGNSAYQNVPALPNPANDARAMAAFLGRAGFDVSSTSDLTQVDMRKAISDFAAKVSLAGTDTVALIYYAGHGVQIDGENFLVPVDALVARESDVPLQAVRLGDVMNMLSAVPSRMRIVMLDACRNNPFSEINKTAGHGLAIVDAPVGSIVSYSTSPGSEAEDGTGENSPYTTAVLKVGAEPGLPIEQAFKRARLSVNQATAGRQTPWESSSLSSDFSFFAGSAPLSPTPPPPPVAENRPQQAKTAAKTVAKTGPAAPAPPSAGGAQLQTVALQSQEPIKTVEMWKRDLRAVSPQQAYDLVITEDEIEAYEAYMSLYGTQPMGARVRGLLDRRHEMIAWYVAVTVGSPLSFQNFLTQYPSSDFAATGMRLLDRSHSRTLMANLPVQPAQVANATPAVQTCSCSPAPTTQGPRRASVDPGTTYYSQPGRVRLSPVPQQYQPIQTGPPLRFGGGFGRGGGYGGGGNFGGRPPMMNYPPKMNGPPMMGHGPEIR